MQAIPKLPKTGFEIRLVESVEERLQVFKLRYQVFVEEIGYVLNHADHTAKTIIEPLDESAQIFAAFYQGQVIGTARKNLAKDSNLGFYSELYRIKDNAGDSYPGFTSISNYIMVQKTFRGSPLILQLVQAVYKQLLIENIKFDFMDCEPNMVNFYQRLGYQNMGQIKHPEFGLGNLMRFDISKLRESP